MLLLNSLLFLAACKSTHFWLYFVYYVPKYLVHLNLLAIILNNLVKEECAQVNSDLNVDFKKRVFISNKMLTNIKSEVNLTLDLKICPLQSGARFLERRRLLQCLIHTEWCIAIA